MDNKTPEISSEEKDNLNNEQILRSFSVIEFNQEERDNQRNEEASTSIQVENKGSTESLSSPKYGKHFEFHHPVTTVPKLESKISIERQSQSIRDVVIDEFKNEINYRDHLLTLPELIKKYGLDIKNGMSSANAVKLLKELGPNELIRGKSKSHLILFLENMFHGLGVIMWVAGILSLIGYFLQKHKNPDEAGQHLGLALMLFTVVILTGLFGFYQEFKSASVMDGFLKMMPPEAKVLRDGQIKRIPRSEVVIGDLVEVRGGDVVPADICLIECIDLKVDNSSLTGESEPLKRSNIYSDPNPLETKNLIFSSSNCVQGYGMGVVIATGNNTMIGHIAVLAKGLEKDETPISKEIRYFLKIITIVAVAFGVLFLYLALFNGHGPVDALVFMLGIMVANVPEGLIVTVTACLTIACQRMAQKNCLVKEMHAVETLGCTSMICSDKTGTLTQNRMTVDKIFFDLTLRDADPDFMADCDELSCKDICLAATLCLHAEFRSPPPHDVDGIRQTSIDGDASEKAILVFMELLTGNTMQIRHEFQKVFEVPFNSTNKFQFSIHHVPDQENLILVMKGAPEVVMSFCTNYCLNGETVELSPEISFKIKDTINYLGMNGQRILAFADFKLPTTFSMDFDFQTEPYNFPLHNLRMLGLIGMIDPPRPGVPDAVRTCKKAGIKVIMVTGDHPTTAMAIAKQVGIISENSLMMSDHVLGSSMSLNEHDEKINAAVITGMNLRRMTNEDIKNLFLKYKEIVFARTSPQQKLRIVEAAQSLGHIVAATGDGVNDSPALKKANIGIAMGIAGNDVSKQAANIILLDDNFASIVTGIEEGRIIYENLKKSIAYTLTSNIPEMIPFLMHIMIGIPLPLVLLYILVIDLGTDIWPAVALAYEKAESDIMNHPPRNLESDKLVNFKLILYSYGLVGVLQACAGFFAFFLVMAANGFSPKRLLFIRNDWDSKSINNLVDSFNTTWSYDSRKVLQRVGQSSYFIAVLVTQIADVIICKTRRNSILQQGMKNWVLNFGILFELILGAIIVYVPFANYILQTEPISWVYWLPGIPFSFLLVFGDELRKYLIRKKPGGWMEKYTYY